jgi:hypothetical protein
MEFPRNRWSRETWTESTNSECTNLSTNLETHSFCDFPILKLIISQTGSPRRQTKNRFKAISSERAHYRLRLGLGPPEVRAHRSPTLLLPALDLRCHAREAQDYALSATTWPHRHVSKSPIIIAPNLPSKALEDGFLDAFPATSAHKIKQHPRPPNLGHTAEIWHFRVSDLICRTCHLLLYAHCINDCTIGTPRNSKGTIQILMPFRGSSKSLQPFHTEPPHL